MAKGAWQSSYFPLRAQSVAYTGTSARTTNAVGDQINIVRLVATTACFIRFGDSTVTATTSDVYLPAGVPEYFSIKSGQRVAAIQASSAGTLYVTEMTQ